MRFATAADFLSIVSGVSSLAGDWFVVAGVWLLGEAVLPLTAGDRVLMAGDQTLTAGDQTFVAAVGSVGASGSVAAAAEWP